MSRVDRLCPAALATMYLSPVLTMVIWSVASQPPLTIVTIGLITVLLACILGAVTRVWRYFFLAQLPISLLSLTFAAYTIGFNMPPGSTLAQLLAGASWEEFRGFIEMNVGYWMALLSAGWTVCYVFLCLKLSRRSIFDDSTDRPSRMVVYSAA